MSNIDKRGLREAAEKATKCRWAVEFDDEIYSTDGVNHEQIAMVFSENEARDAAFIAAANPATVLALLDELEAKDKSISFLKNQLAQLANFNPDWDKLESATDSLREHMAELTAARKRIAELSHHLQNAHEFIEHTEAFGHEASNGILCCGDAQWNIDASKSALSASGFNGEV
ncbi:ead/Ea22-like family protein [Salmonella enterica]|nr:ead/Ea22-like family protein [Salmonella enterica]